MVSPRLLHNALPQILCQYPAISNCSSDGFLKSSRHWLCLRGLFRLRVHSSDGDKKIASRPFLPRPGCAWVRTGLAGSACRQDESSAIEQREAEPRKRRAPPAPSASCPKTAFAALSGGVESIGGRS